MIPLRRGAYLARLAQTMGDTDAAQRLRARALRLNQTRDVDRFDAICDHVLVERIDTGSLVCTFRFLPRTGQTIARSYAAQFYELSGLEDFSGKMVEMGRFCVAPGVADPDVVRLAWAAMTRVVDANQIDLIFGCSSFSGTETAQYLDAFAMLKARHLAPKRWLPRVKAPDVFRFAQRLRGAPDMKQAMLRMPPLLRTYLMMGGWVSDHAVVDRQLNTLHVFTGVEVSAIPAARKRLLRVVAG